MLGAGVAIFHIASGRVVICSAVDRKMGLYYFLPKGRRDAGEESGRGAEREGYEEVYIPTTNTYMSDSMPTNALNSQAIATASSLSP